MATTVASSHNSHYHRLAVCSSARRVSNNCRVRVNPSPACVARLEDAVEDKAAASRRVHCHRAHDHDEKPRRTKSPPVMRRRRRGASPDSKRRRGSDARAEYYYYRRPDEAHRRGRDDAHRAADKMEGEDRDTGRSSSSRSSKERRAPRAYIPSPAQCHHHHPAAESIVARPRAADEDRKRKRSPEMEVVDQAEDAEEARRRREELQRMREEARRELDKVVRTVWFNDPYISPTCVLNTMPRWSWNEVEEGEVV